MIFNKRAIMLKFLVTVILAIIIFAPACAFLSKFFRLSDQAKDSFNEFTDIIHDVEQGKASQLYLLKLDRKTALAYFEPHEEKVFLFVEGVGTERAPSGDVYFTRPNTCTDITKSCLCLLQDVEGDKRYTDEYQKRPTDTDKPARVQAEAIFTATTGRCVQDFSTPLSITSCTLGTTHGAAGYFCQHGFVLERELLKEKGFPAYLIAPRRIALQIEKQENTILITPT